MRVLTFPVASDYNRLRTITLCNDFPTSMTSEPYLIQLGNRLLQGLKPLPDEWKRRHINFVDQRQYEDGGFPGREGDSDLYYTGFAVRTLASLEGLDEGRAKCIGEYLQSHDPLELNVIDLLNWLTSAFAVQISTGQDLLAEYPAQLPSQIIARLESLRRDDGGYAKSEEGAISSTYHSFLIVLMYELMCTPLPQPNEMIQFIFDRQRDDGGFVEIAPMKRSGTNPTAAAVAILKILNAIDEELPDDVAGFLRDVWHPGGGFLANTRIPFADALSTFTGLLTATDLGFVNQFDLGAIRHHFETQLEFPTGGYRAAEWDETADIEYTFYGVGTIALLNLLQGIST